MTNFLSDMDLYGSEVVKLAWPSAGLISKQHEYDWFWKPIRRRQGCMIMYHIIISDFNIRVMLFSTVLS